MAETLPQKLGTQVAAFGALPLQRQFGLLAGMAIVIALVVSVVSWGMRPTYEMLMPQMSERDKADAMAALSRHDIPNHLDPASGTLMVPTSKLHEARLHLATEGLPHSDGVGFELLDQETGIGTSRMLENARYQRALEGELSRSVMTLQSVETARVHLALPPKSVFVREHARPSASVLLNLHPGRNLDDVQIAGIVHLVASSVSELEPERVTVVDSRGRLLSESGGITGAGAEPGRQLEYTAKLEENIRGRVRAILAPLVGEENVRVQVAAVVDFTQVESTRESYDGDNRALVSEQVIEETSGAAPAGGVPGALTNQPPGGATVARGDTAQAQDEVEAPGPTDSSRRSTRNYEVDRTVSHTRNAPATLERLSVAVVVNHRETVGEEGEASQAPRDAAELDYLETLVKEAIGFDEARGDRVSLVNASFEDMDREFSPLPDTPIWKEPWLRDLAKQALAGIGVLALVLMVLRPTLKTLAQPAPLLARHGPQAALPSGGGAPPESAAGAVAGELEAQRPEMPARRTLDNSVERARSLATEDPRLVAHVVKQWMGKDD